MKYTKLSFTLLISILILGVTSMNVFGFLFGSARTEKWKEEVQLSDGRIIVVERETVMERGGDEWAINRSGKKSKEKRIRFEYPTGSGKMIEWRSKKISPSIYPESPLIFDMESGHPIVFTIVAVSEGEEIYSKYFYRDGVWIEETLPEIFEKRRTNLYLRVGKGLIDLETKRKNNDQPGYYSINLREVGPNRKVNMYRRR